MTPSLPDGWFRTDGDGPRLHGSRCTTCGTVAFPPRSTCPDPGCDGTDPQPAPLSDRGRLWSWTVNHYPPPPPAVAPEPYVPHAIAAVELVEERMVVLGRLAAGADASSLQVGQEMELATGDLLEPDGTTTPMWAWRPAEAS